MSDFLAEVTAKTIIVHNDAPHGPRTRSGVNGPNGFRVWTWIVLCNCGCRPDMGEHFVVAKPTCESAD